MRLKELTSIFLPNSAQDCLHYPVEVFRIVLGVTRYPIGRGGHYEVGVSGRGNGHDVKAGLVERPGHIVIFAAVMRGTGPGYQENQMEPCLFCSAAE